MRRGFPTSAPPSSGCRSSSSQPSFPVILEVGGVEASGKGDIINILNGWLDPRGFETFAFHEPTDEERERPAMWRYWRTLPANGRMAIYAGGWHADALHEDPRSARELAQFDAMLRRIAWFEGQLAAGGALIIKVWLNLSKSFQKTRLRELESDPRTAWRVTPEDWKSQRDYDRLARLAERLRSATHQPGAPWYVVDAWDPRARNLAVADILLSRFRDPHAGPQAGGGGPRPPPQPDRPAATGRPAPAPLAAPRHQAVAGGL